MQTIKVKFGIYKNYKEEAMQNPFTTTFCKSPEYSYIATDRTTENFSYENPSESVYKITGEKNPGIIQCTVTDF